MTERLRVILEIGEKRRVVAGAMDWPGLDRWGTSDDDAIAKLMSYVPRYAAVAERAGQAKRFAKAATSTSSSGSPASPRPTTGASRMSLADRAGGAVGQRAGAPARPPAGLLGVLRRGRRPCLAELRLGPRGGGRSRDQLVRHVNLNEPEQFTRKVEVRTPTEEMVDPGRDRSASAGDLDAIRAYNAEGQPARTWPIQFLIRRIAHHVMDHAWEMEDRDLSDDTLSA